MAHHSRIDKIVMDIAPADHDRAITFWSGATGRPLAHSEQYPEYHWGEIPGQDVGVLVQRLDEGASRVRVCVIPTAGSG